MSIESQDRELTIAMREVLAFAQRLMPESIFCVLSFTQAEDGSPLGLNKIATNSTDRDALQEQVFTVMTHFVKATVVDLTDVKGGMQ